MATVASKQKADMLANMMPDRNARMWIGCINAYDSDPGSYDNTAWKWDTSFSTAHGTANARGVYRNQVVGNCNYPSRSDDEVDHYYGWSEDTQPKDDSGAGTAKRCTVLPSVHDRRAVTGRPTVSASPWEQVDCSPPQPTNVNVDNGPYLGYSYVCEASTVDTTTTCPGGQFNSGASKERITRYYTNKDGDSDDDGDDNDENENDEDEGGDDDLYHSDDPRQTLEWALDYQKVLNLPDGCTSCDHCLFKKRDRVGHVVCPECVSCLPVPGSPSEVFYEVPSGFNISLDTTEAERAQGVGAHLARSHTVGATIKRMGGNRNVAMEWSRYKIDLATNALIITDLGYAYTTPSTSIDTVASDTMIEVG